MGTSKNHFFQLKTIEKSGFIIMKTAMIIAVSYMVHVIKMRLRPLHTISAENPLTNRCYRRPVPQENQPQYTE